MATANREDYVKQIYILQQRRGGAVATGELAMAVGVTAASANGMIKTLVELELASHEPYAGVRLTGQGEKLALHILRRHRLIELFLVRTLEIDWSEVHREAEAIEHVVSESLLERIDEFLGRPQVDPHGDPIPDAQGRLERLEHTRLSECSSGDAVCIARVLDQEPQFLRFIERQGLKPGAQLTFLNMDGDAQLIELKTADGRCVALSTAAAGKLLVRPA